MARLTDGGRKVACWFGRMSVAKRVLQKAASPLFTHSFRSVRTIPVFREAVGASSTRHRQRSFELIAMTFSLNENANLERALKMHHSATWTGTVPKRTSHCPLLLESQIRQCHAFQPREFVSARAFELAVVCRHEVYCSGCVTNRARCYPKVRQRTWLVSGGHPRGLVQDQARRQLALSQGMLDHRQGRLDINTLLANPAVTEVGVGIALTAVADQGHK